MQVQDIFCADIGGTQSRFAHFTLQGQSLHLRGQHVCATASLQSAEQALLVAKAGTGLNPEHAVIHIWGMAGPIHANGYQATLTNTPLTLDFSPLTWLQPQKNFFLLNDFALQAWASLATEVPLLPVLNPHENSGQSPHHAHNSQNARGVLGAGTGLGAAALLPFGQNQWTLLQAEAGHTEMPFHGKEELDFAHFAKQKLQQKRLTAEHILGAQGLSLLHAYVHQEEVSPAQAAAFLYEGQKESVQGQLYARFLGRFCRHWALTTLCTGGLYLGGGVLMKNPQITQSASFKEEFYTAPAAMQKILSQIPVWLMQHENPALWGAAYMAKSKF